MSVEYTVPIKCISNDYIHSPIIQVCNLDTPVNMLLDSGAIHSLIFKDSLYKFRHTATNESIDFQGIGTETTVEPIVKSFINKDNYVFSSDFIVKEADVSDFYKTNFGITVDGLLGSSFFYNYNASIDYNKGHLKFTQE